MPTTRSNDFTTVDGYRIYSRTNEAGVTRVMAVLVKDAPHNYRTHDGRFTVLGVSPVEYRVKVDGKTPKVDDGEGGFTNLYFDRLDGAREWIATQVDLTPAPEVEKPAKAPKDNSEKEAIKAAKAAEREAKKAERVAAREAAIAARAEAKAKREAERNEAAAARVREAQERAEAKIAAAAAKAAAAKTEDPANDGE